MVDINCCVVLWPRSTVTTIRSETNFDRFSGLDIDHVDCCIVLVILNLTIKLSIKQVTTK